MPHRFIVTARFVVAANPLLRRCAQAEESMVMASSRRAA